MFPDQNASMPAESSWGSQQAWNVVEDPNQNRPGAISGPMSGWRHPYRNTGRVPVPQTHFDVPEEEAAALAQNSAHSVLASVSRRSLNLMILAAVLIVLGIPIYIGLHHLPQSTFVSPGGSAAKPLPTAVAGSGYLAYNTKTFSLAYPAQWTSASATQTVSMGFTLQGQSFTTSNNTAFHVYMTTAFPADEFQQVQDAIAADFAPHQTPQGIKLNAVSTHADVKWHQSDYAITKVVGNTDVRMRLRVIVGDAGAHGFVIIMLAPQAQFERIDSASFEPMFRSLHVAAQ